MENYQHYDALGLADLIARGEVTADEALDAARSLAAEVNPRINAIGSQFVGRLGSEPQLIRLAAQLEAARPWADRLPSAVASCDGADRACARRLGPVGE